MEGHKVVHMKHETSCLSQWMSRHPKGCCGKQSILHHGHNGEGRSSLDLEIGHKWNELN